MKIGSELYLGDCHYCNAIRACQKVSIFENKMTKTGYLCRECVRPESTAMKKLKERMDKPSRIEADGELGSAGKNSQD